MLMLMLPIKTQCSYGILLFAGRDFPRRPQHRLVVEAQFHGERLASEGVWHEPSPQFFTELAWEMTQHSLHQHKLKRTPVKISVCFVLDHNICWPVSKLVLCTAIVRCVSSTAWLQQRLGSHGFF